MTWHVFYIFSCPFFSSLLPADTIFPNLKSQLIFIILSLNKTDKNFWIGRLRLDNILDNVRLVVPLMILKKVLQPQVYNQVDTKASKDMWKIKRSNTRLTLCCEIKNGENTKEKIIRYIIFKIFPLKENKNFQTCDWLDGSLKRNTALIKNFSWPAWKSGKYQEYRAPFKKNTVTDTYHKGHMKEWRNEI